MVVALGSSSQRSSYGKANFQRPARYSSLKNVANLSATADIARSLSVETVRLR
jgi:hypothetical protein